MNGNYLPRRLLHTNRLFLRRLLPESVDLGWFYCGGEGRRWDREPSENPARTMHRKANI